MRASQAVACPPCTRNIDQLDHAEKESDRSNVTGSEWFRSAYNKLEEERITEREHLIEEIRTERSARETERENFIEEMRTERSARERLEERFEAFDKEARNIRNGFTNSPQDKPQEQDNGSKPNTYPDKGMKPSEQNNDRNDKDRNRWDHPSAQDPP